MMMRMENQFGGEERCPLAQPPATGHWFPSTCQSLKVTSTIKFSLGDKSKVRPDTETDAKYTTHLLTGTGGKKLNTVFMLSPIHISTEIFSVKSVCIFVTMNHSIIPTLYCVASDFFAPS